MDYLEKAIVRRVCQKHALFIRRESNDLSGLILIATSHKEAFNIGFQMSNIFDGTERKYELWIIPSDKLFYTLHTLKGKQHVLIVLTEAVLPDKKAQFIEALPSLKDDKNWIGTEILDLGVTIDILRLE